MPLGHQHDDGAEEKHAHIIKKKRFKFPCFNTFSLFSLFFTPFFLSYEAHMSRDMRVPTMWYVRLAYAQSDQSLC